MKLIVVNIFVRVPEYQVNAIKTYFQRAKDLPASSFYNSSGRAYPDVSALSSDFTVVIDLLPMPGVAGIFTLCHAILIISRNFLCCTYLFWNCSFIK